MEYLVERSKRYSCGTLERTNYVIFPSDSIYLSSDGFCCVDMSRQLAIIKARTHTEAIRKYKEIAVQEVFAVHMINVMENAIAKTD